MVSRVREREHRRRRSLPALLAAWLTHAASAGETESWRAVSRQGQNGRVTSGRSTMPEMLALRSTDPREVGGYRLLGRLGEGGQGVVFLAVGPTGSRAAVKLLPPTTDPQVRSRFLKE